MDTRWRQFFQEANDSDWHGISELPLDKLPHHGNQQSFSRLQTWQSKQSTNEREHVQPKADELVFMNPARELVSRPNVVEAGNQFRTQRLERDNSDEIRHPHRDTANRPARDVPTESGHPFADATGDASKKLREKPQKADESRHHKSAASFHR